MIEMSYECSRFFYAQLIQNTLNICIFLNKLVLESIKYHSELYITVKTQQSLRKIFPQRMDVSATP